MQQTAPVPNSSAAQLVQAQPILRLVDIPQGRQFAPAIGKSIPLPRTNTGRVRTPQCREGYLGFDAKLLDPALGFWVNMPATATSTTTTTSTVTTTTYPTIPAASAAASWTFNGTVFSTYESGSYFGGVQGALADVTVLPLMDGRFRIFIGGVPVTPTTPRGIHSAISGDGVSFTLESGPRVASPYPTSATTSASFAHPHVVRLDDGRVRLFVMGGWSSDPQPITGGIYSLTSSDEGMTFTLDPGLRISAAALGVGEISGPAVKNNHPLTFDSAQSAC